MPDVAEIAISDALRNLYALPSAARSSIDRSPVAELGPPTGVKPFQPGEASTGAFLAKLGARIFQRARERATAREQLQKQRLDEDYRRAQIERLEALAQPKPTYSVQSGGHTFEGLTPDQAARFTREQGKDAGDALTTDPETGKPLAAPMSMSEWLRFRGQNKAGERAAATRVLAETLAGQRGDRATRAQESLDIGRQLSALDIPSEQSTWIMAQQAAEDSLVRAGQRRPVGEQRVKRLQRSLHPRVRQAAVDSVTARRQALLKVLEGRTLQQDLSPETMLLIRGIQNVMDQAPDQ